MTSLKRSNGSLPSVSSTPAITIGLVGRSVRSQAVSIADMGLRWDMQATIQTATRRLLALRQKPRAGSIQDWPYLQGTTAMRYFITGATGFIGSRLARKLLEREGSTVYFLVRERRLKKVDALRRRWGVGPERAIPVVGDLTLPRLGVSDADLERLRGVEHMFHLAAVYDLRASAEAQQAANVEGTRHAVELAHEAQVGCLHLASSIAAAGLYEGVFREDMFEEAENLEHPYFRTKHDSEAIVRERVPPAVARLPPGHRGGRLAHGRDGQDRRPVLLLQADPEAAPRAAGVDARDRGRRRAPEPGAGGLRGGRDGPHRAPARPRRQVLSPHRPQAAAGGRHPQSVRARRVMRRR